MNDIRVSSLTVRVAGKDILRDISCHAPTGQLTGIVGPNGAGKSTLLRAMAGLLPHATGTCLVSDVDPRERSDRERARIAAYVPQNLPQGMPQSVLWLAASGRRAWMGSLAMETEEDLAAARRALQELGIAHLAPRTASTLSGGELQLVMLASALASQARVLLLDEPTSMLDPGNQQRLLRVLVERCAEGHTIVAAVHDLNLAARWFDHILFLDQGRLLASGPPSAVLRPEVLSATYGDAVEVIETPHGPAVLPRSRSVP